MTETVLIRIPDIGGATDIDVIEIYVKPGDKIAKEDPLIALEGDKAAMDVPSSEAGIVESIQVKVGDKVAEGSAILTLQVAKADVTSVTAAQKSVSSAKIEPTKTAEFSAPPSAKAPVEQGPSATTYRDYSQVHAGPSVRRIAHEFGVDLTRVSATGPKGRILKQDLQNYVKSELQKSKTATAGGLAVSPMPVIDFSKFGEIETKPLNKIKRLTGINVHRSWVTVPHVTQFSEADITDMEAFRQKEKANAEKQGVKLTPLVFIMKAVVASLQAFPIVNSSLDASGENIIYKKYFHIGIAVDTPNGLVVAVVRDVDKKGYLQLAKELADISNKAREKGLSPADMAGGCFTISSLGGIGGTAFTPIVNTPEVAILGVSRNQIKPVYLDGEFTPRMMLPLSLSYDHRVVDGADGARFITHLCRQLEDIRELLL